MKRFGQDYFDEMLERVREIRLSERRLYQKITDIFLELADYPVLTDTGKITMLEAKLKAESEYDKFRIIQDENFVSDFDRELKKTIRQ